MPQKKSTPNIGLLTPAQLQEIRAKVLRWINDHPADIRALMSQGVEMIESIIRYRLRDRLGPAAPKSPVLGGIGVAYAPDEFTEANSRLYMDTGMLIQTVSDLLGSIDPITVYGGKKLQAYDGTLMPDLTYDYMLGVGIGAECPYFADSWTWGSQGEYVSDPNIGTDMAALLTGGCGATSAYTGLLRLAAQAKLGAGRSPAELSAWYQIGCVLDPKSDGLFRDEAGVYWVIRTDEFGCKCARLTTYNQHAQCLLDWISDGDLVGDEAMRAEAYALSTMEVEKIGGAAVQYELLSASDLSDVYVDNLSPLGNVWGWAYSRGHLGVGIDGQVTEAVIVTHRIHHDIGVAKYLEATLARVVFDLSGSIPTAELFIDEQDVQWEPSVGDLIFYPQVGDSGPRLCYVEAGSFDSSPRGLATPLYAFYRADGLEVFRYSYREPGSWSNDGAHDFPKCCGCGSSQDYETLNVSGNKSGVGGAIFAERSGVQLNTYQFNDSNALLTYKRTVMALGDLDERNCNETGTSNIDTQVKIQADFSSCSGTDTSLWPGIGNYRYDMQTAEARGFIEEYKARAGAINRVLIIPFGDREAGYLVETFKSGIITVNKTTPVINSPDPPACNITITDRDTGQVIDSFPNAVDISSGFGLGELPCSTTVNALFDSANEVVGDTGPGAGRINEVALVTSSERVIRSIDGLSLDFDDWDEWYQVYLQLPPLDNCTPNIQLTRTSFYHFDTWFSSGPSSSKTLITEYDVAVQPTTVSYVVIPLGWN